MKATTLLVFICFTVFLMFIDSSCYESDEFTPEIACNKIPSLVRIDKCFKNANCYDILKNYVKSPVIMKYIVLYKKLKNATSTQELKELCEETSIIVPVTASLSKCKADVLRQCVNKAGAIYPAFHIYLLKICTKQES